MDSSTLHFLGTGNAFNADGRGSQSFVVRPVGRGPFLVDVGPTVVAAVERFGVDTSGLDRVFVTHLHGDHVAGWPFLLLRLAFIDRRDRPLEVVGPTGTKGCLEALMHHCYDDLADKLGFELSYRELPIARATDLVAGKTRFDVLPMDHHPTSVAYR